MIKCNRRSAAWLALALWGMTLPSVSRAQTLETSASDAVNQVTHWVTATRDNNGWPFIVIDKIAAEVFVFNGTGALVDRAPALLGSAPGDESVPGIGDRQLNEIKPHERTTPAGRFVANFGVASGNRQVLWVDYSTAISLHAVITTNKQERRLERLQSPTPDDNRISYGCINVPTDFYANIVRPLFTNTLGLVYILPEAKSLHAVFPAMKSTKKARH